MTNTNSQSSFAKLTAFLMRMRWLIVLTLIIAGASYYLLIPDQNEEATTIKRLSTVTRGDIENTVTAAGALTSKDWVSVGAQVSGQLKSISVKVGDIVKKGQLLAEIDATVQVARVNASRASLNALKSQQKSRESKLKLAKLTAERQARMINDKATSAQEYDKAQNALIEAQASLLQLKAQIAQSEASLSSQDAELGYTTIYAPMDGTVVSVVAKQGQTLNANNQAPTILTIADLTEMTVEAEVSEADINKLKKGMPVYFSTLGGGQRRWKSHVRQILPTPSIANNVVLYTVLFDVDNSDAALLSQMTAQVFFVTSSAENVISVPVGALTFIDDDKPNNKGAMKEKMANLTDEQRAELREKRKNREARDGNKGPRGGDKPRRGKRPELRNGEQSTKPRLATVSREVSEGIYETVEVKIGVTSRIAAEVISGLKVGDRVVSGIIQKNNDREQNSDRSRSNRIPRGL